MHLPNLTPRLGAAVASLSALAASFWVATCAAAPEFLWRGLHLAAEHLTLADLLSALLIGLVLAFFVDPLMEKMRQLLHRAKQGEALAAHPRSALFAAATSIAFALASVSLHDVILAFVHGPGAQYTAANPSLTVSIAVAAAWAIVPFVITLAWLSIGIRWVTVSFAIVALLSPAFAGWFFAWSPREVVTTFIPCALILGLGYRAVARAPAGRAGARCARSVALVSLVWLAATALIDAGADLTHAPQFRLYDALGFWTDARFYLGWTLGLLLAPFPSTAAKPAI